MRESPTIPLIEGLLAAGARVQTHDPKATDSARTIFGDRVMYAADPYSAAHGADALLVMTEWLVYRNPDFERLRKLLRRPLLIDGRNLYDPDRMIAQGFEYHGIGAEGAGDPSARHRRRGLHRLASGRSAGAPRRRGDRDRQLRRLLSPRHEGAEPARDGPAAPGSPSTSRTCGTSRRCRPGSRPRPSSSTWPRAPACGRRWPIRWATPT